MLTWQMKQPKEGASARDRQHTSLTQCDIAFQEAPTGWSSTFRCCPLLSHANTSRRCGTSSTPLPSPSSRPIVQNYSNQLLIRQFADHTADHASSPLNPERQTSSGSPSRREQARLHRVYQVWQGRRAAHKSLGQ